MKFLKGLFSKSKKEVLLEQESPCCPIMAVVEQDANVAYLYLYGPNESRFGMKACWIRNLKAAPEEVKKDSIEKGNPPMLPTKFCQHPEGLPPLKKKALKLVWFEEGDGVALLENNEVIAIIPSWGGIEGFMGYAKDAKGQGNFAWELKSDNILFDRIRKAEMYWKEWDNDPSPFNIMQPELIKIYESKLGESEKYFAIDGNEWPPVGLFVKHEIDKCFFVTVGASLRPQPQIEMFFDNPEEVNRVEFGLRIDGLLDDEQIRQIAGGVSMPCKVPWENITWIGEGHTINFTGLERFGFEAVLITNRIKELPTIDLPDYRSSNVNILWLIPISKTERASIIEDKSDGFIAKMNELGEDVFDIHRLKK